MTDNVHAFQRWYLRPRVLRSARNLSTTTSFLGIDMALPVFTSPAGVHDKQLHIFLESDPVAISFME